ncbi:MAG: hypothetical protein AAGK32_18690, partial [Actinomycetota bacterium]
MLVVALIVVAVLAIVFAGLYLTTRSSAAEYRQQADKREADLQAERDQLNTDKAGLQTELNAAKRETERINEKANASAAEVRRLGGELDKARSVADQQTERIESQAARILEFEGEVAALEAQVEVAETAAASAMARASGIVIGAMTDDGARPETLWDLELTRSERTWRTSVATNPEADDSPFDDVDDPVRLAIEIEAAALRENVGAAIDVEWEASAVENPMQRHLVVRVAQELLESAARSPEPSVLRVADGDDGELQLSLSSAEDEADLINFIPPRITSDLLTFKEESGV